MMGKSKLTATLQGESAVDWERFQGRIRRSSPLNLEAEHRLLAV